MKAIDFLRGSMSQRVGTTLLSVMLCVLLFAGGASGAAIAYAQNAEAERASVEQAGAEVTADVALSTSDRFAEEEHGAPGKDATATTSADTLTDSIDSNIIDGCVTDSDTTDSTIITEILSFAAELFPAAATQVKIRETGVCYATLREAVDAANVLPGANTIEVFEDTAETTGIRVTSDITIVAASAAPTITLTNHNAPASGITIDQGGSLTLGDAAGDSSAPILTIIAPEVVSQVLYGFATVHNGVHLKTSTVSTSAIGFHLTGAGATGSITGGTIEGGSALVVEHGAKISKISGGTITGIHHAVHVRYAGSEIDTISGGRFLQTSATTTFDGIACYLRDEARINHITGGYFEAARYYALAVTWGSSVSSISNATFVAKSTYGGWGNSQENPPAGIAIVWPGGKSTGIGSITNTVVQSAGYYGILSYDEDNARDAYIDNITDVTVTALMVALQNDRGSTIQEISGGSFTAAQGALLNSGSIKTISGGAFTATSSSAEYALWNYDSGTINVITGGSFTGARYGLSNNGYIKEISGGTFIGEYYAVNASGFNGPKKIDIISGGTFWGKYFAAIKLANKTLIEPGLTTEGKGFARFWGANGQIFSNESYVTYPHNTQLDLPYHMSARSEAVADIADVKFKYLTARIEGPLYTVTLRYINQNGAALDLGEFEEGETVAINAGSAENYDFTNWVPYVWTGSSWAQPSKFDGNVNAVSTSFTMPGNYVWIDAYWTQKTYTVNYDTQRGTPATLAAKTVKWPSADLLPTETVSRTSYSFEGWFTKPDGGTQVDALTPYSALPEADKNVRSITLYAHWDEDVAPVVPGQYPNPQPDPTPGSVVSEPKPVVPAPIEEAVPEPSTREAAPEPTTGNPVVDLTASTTVDTTLCVSLFGVQIPLYGSSERSAWSLFNLVCTILAIVLMLGSTIRFVRIHKPAGENEEDTRSSRSTYFEDMEVIRYCRPPLLIVAIALAIFSVILFIFTQDLTRPMAIFDYWSIAFVLGAILAIITRKTITYKRKPDESQEPQQAQPTIP